MVLVWTPIFAMRANSQMHGSHDDQVVHQLGGSVMEPHFCDASVLVSEHMGHVLASEHMGLLRRRE